MLERFFDILEPHRRILLSTHENPDGDGVGSMIALGHCLRSMGKEIRIVVSPEIPAFLEFLDTEGWIEIYEPGGAHADLAAWPGAWLLVDASEPHRMGQMLERFQASKALKVCLDHHLKDAPQGFDMEFTDATASASAELVYDLVSSRLPRPFAPMMVDAMYAGLVDDTGNFRFSNSTSKVHRIAASLIEDGADPSGIYQALYHQNRSQRLRLFGRAYESLRILGEGQYGSMVLSQADLKACGAIHDDMEGLVNEPLKLRGIEVAALIYEMGNGRVKASLRSRGRVDVNAVCKRFGGGGHRLASGAKLDGLLDQVQTKVDAAVLAQIQKDMAPD
jgi:bifunctional oligoribonuclease and PAP phosphatase NrnA